MKKVIIFDIDGTLIDSTWMHAKAWQEAFRTHGYHFEISELLPHIGRGAKGLITDFIGAQGYEEMGEELTAEHESNFEQLGEGKPFPLVKELFAELKNRKKTILLASSATTQTVDRHIDLLSVKELIDGRVSGSQVSVGKPSPDIFIAALNLVSADPKMSVVVGDSIWDMEAANNAGIDLIGVLTGSVSREELEKAGAKEIYKDIAELYRNLDKSLLR